MAEEIKFNPDQHLLPEAETTQIAVGKIVFAQPAQRAPASTLATQEFDPPVAARLQPTRLLRLNS